MDAWMSIDNNGILQQNDYNSVTDEKIVPSLNGFFKKPTMQGALSVVRSAAVQMVDLQKDIVHSIATAIVRATARKMQEARDWDLSFGPVYGEGGSCTTITVTPQCFFRGEKIMATDSLKGEGSRITMVLVGQRLQRPATGGGTLTKFFSSDALGNGIKWDTCQPSLSIAVTVSFIESCTFDMAVFGRAIV